MSTPKLIIRGDAARQKLRDGVMAVAEAVVSTLGPKGRNVGIERPWGGTTHVVHDGVTVARSVNLKDPGENRGAEMVKEASSRTNDIAGDGTTTSMALAMKMVDEGLKYVTAGMNPMILKEGIEQAVRAVDAELVAMAQPVDDAGVEKIAVISAASPEIGAIVGEAIVRVGKNGVITAQLGSGPKTTVEYKDGMEIEGGYITQYFVTDPHRMEADLADTLVLVTDQEMSSAANEIVPLVENLAEQGYDIGTKLKNIVFIAPNIERSALQMLVQNHLAGNMQTIAIKAPDRGKRQRDLLEDIAAFVGATLITKDGVTFKDIKFEHLGHADRVIANQKQTVIVAEERESAKARVAALSTEIARENNPTMRERLENRVARLRGGIAVISVGAPSTIEQEEKLERVKDAIGATQAAIEEGIIPGGGSTLAHIARKLEESTDLDVVNGKQSEEIHAGIRLVLKALYHPLFVLARNAGARAEAVVDKVVEAGYGIGYNVMTERLVPMIDAGIIDPVKVTRHALINAASVAQMILTTDTLILEDPDADKPAGA